MTLVVETPPSWAAERAYILAIVLGRWLGLQWTWSVSDRTDVRISVAGDGQERAVVVPDVMFSADAWLSPASLPLRPLASVVDAADLLGWDRLPVIYGTAGQPESITFSQNGAHLGIDVFGSVFFMITRYEEAVLQRRDEHRRFPMSASLAWLEGFSDKAIVDGYVEMLWTAILSQWPQLMRRRTEFRLVLTHDVDFARAADDRAPSHLVRAAGGDVVKRHDVDLARRRVLSFARSRDDFEGSRDLDPYDTFGELMTVSEEHGLTSTFFFIAAVERTGMGGNYALEDPWISRRLIEINHRGHEIGLHGSFGSFRHPAAVTNEVRRLESIAAGLEIQQETFGGRQHFLRWDNSTTWPAYEAAGLSYDTSVGYAEDIGFRAGTCREYPAYDLIARRQLNLMERPLHVMDGAIAPYLEFPSTDAVARVLAMAAQCRRFRGSMVVLWHNTSIASNRAKRQYRELIAALMSST